MMNKKEIFKKIGGIISELTEQYQYLSENLDHLNDLELELFTANSKFLTDHAEILKKLNAKASNAGQKPEPSPYQEPAQVPFNEPAAEPLQPQRTETPDLTAVPEAETEEDQKENTEHETFEAAIESPSESVQREKTPEIEEIEPEHAEEDNFQPAAQEVEEEEPAFENHSNEMVQEVIIPEKTVSVEVPQPEAPSALRPTLNDLISARKNQAAATGINRPQQIKDLKSAISLNDKLLFIKELFNGYSLAYSEAIEILNRFETFDAADAFLKTNYAEKNNWAATEPIVEKLYELLRNRYSL